MSRSNFYREFERVYGLSPSAYREKQLPGTVSSSREV
jgi:AraC-like DNA-binding protein